MTQRNIRYDDDVILIINEYVATQQAKGRKISQTTAINEIIRNHQTNEKTVAELSNLAKTLVTDVTGYFKESLSREFQSLEARIGKKLR